MKTLSMKQVRGKLERLRDRRDALHDLFQGSGARFQELHAARKERHLVMIENADRSSKTRPPEVFRPLAEFVQVSDSRLTALGVKPEEIDALREINDRANREQAKRDQAGAEWQAMRQLVDRLEAHIKEHMA